MNDYEGREVQQAPGIALSEEQRLSLLRALERDGGFQIRIDVKDVFREGVNVNVGLTLLHQHDDWILAVTMRPLEMA